MSVKTDARQIRSRDTLTQLAANVANKELDDLLRSADSELTMPLRMKQTYPSADRVVNIGSISVTNPEHGRKRTIPPIAGGVLPTFASGTITVDATGAGNATPSVGSALALGMTASKFLKIGVHVDSTGAIVLTKGVEGASEAAATAAPAATGTHWVGYFVVSTDGSNNVQNITDAYIYQYAGGGGGGGSGSGEINVIDNPSDSTNWGTSSATVATNTTAANNPLAGVIDSSIAITSSTSSGYARYRWTMPPALKNKKLKAEWHQIASTLVSGDFKVEVYKNSASDYSGSYTEFALSTDVSGDSLIENLNGKYTTSFDADGGDYYELRVIRTGSGSKTIYLANVIVGPGIQPQGAVVGPPIAYTPTAVGFGTISGVIVSYTRRGSYMKVQGRFSTGTPTATPASLSLPTGLNVDTSVVSSNFIVGRWTRNQASGSTRKMGALATDIGTNTNIVRFASDDAATGLAPATSLDGNALAASTEVIWVDFEVPIAEWAGSGTVNVAQNDVAYIFNSSTSTSTDSTSFGYGSGGVNFVAINDTGATIKKRARNLRAIGASSGKPKLEVSSDGILWVSAESMFPYMESITEKYGMRIVAGGTALTDMDVEFGGDGANGTEAWSAYTTWKWRITVELPGVAIGFGLATDTQAGLISSNAQTIGGAKTFTSKLLLSNGSVTAPSIGFSSDDDGSGTGIYRVGANNLGFAANGVAVGNISSSGAWTIGPQTGSSIAHLIYGGNVGAGPALRMYNAHATSGNAAFYMGKNGTDFFDIITDPDQNGNGVVAVQAPKATTGEFRFYTGGATETDRAGTIRTNGTWVIGDAADTSFAGNDIVGRKDGSAVSAGYVGEVLYAYRASGAPLGLTSATFADVNTLALTNGIWTISAALWFQWSGATFASTDFTYGWCQTSGNSSTGRRDGITFFASGGFTPTAGGILAAHTPPVTVRINGSTLTFPDGATLTLTSQTIYHKAYAAFTSGSMSVIGQIQAVRIA